MNTLRSNAGHPLVASILIPGLLALAVADATAQQGGLRGGGELSAGRPAAHPPCLSTADRARVAEQIASYEARFGPISGPADAAPAPYAFYPQAGTHYEDLTISNFCDLAPGASILDYRCDAYTYDGHDATDSCLIGFGEQARNAPIFAAQDGVVIGTHDGEPDMNVVWANVPANYVLVDHGNGRVAYYWHMRKNSVAVAPGQPVIAGQQLGLTGSSGMSNWPHLHFGTYDGGVMKEPFAGACNPGASSWVQQLPFDSSLVFEDFGLSRDDLTPFQPPYEFPRTGNVATSDGLIYVWYFLKHQPAGSTWRFVFVRPDGSTAYDTGTNGFFNPEYFFSWWWFSWDVADMHTIPGTWHVKTYVNGVLQVDAPVVVQTVYDAAFNQAPEAVGAALEPAVPDDGDALTCRVTGDRIKNDLDYDIVSHHFVWSGNGAVVRDVTSAARSDMLPARPAATLVLCRVNPTDGTAAGATVTESVMVAPTPWTKLGNALAGSNGLPLLEAGGTATAGSAGALSLRRFKPLTPATLFVGVTPGNAPFKQGVLVPVPPLLMLFLATNAQGELLLPFTWPGGVPSNANIYFQAWMADAGGPAGFSASNALKLLTP